MVASRQPLGSASNGAYVAPALVSLGSLHDLTLEGCDKRLGASDGFTFMGQPIVCRDSA